MEPYLFRFSANIKTDIFLKDPETSQIGTAIINQSIDLINEIGFEEFNFKKLSARIGTTEATIYRYFENKHKLLLYITSWYWCWVEYQLVLHNTNITDPQVQLKNTIKVLATPTAQHYADVNLQSLFNIICSESCKSYLIKNVDDLNKYGVYFNYKKIVSIISVIIKLINPTYMYPHMLVTTIIEGIHNQKYFAEHLPALTDKTDAPEYLINFYYQLTIDTINKSLK
ncbi:MAG: helix-turn-helix transcriptional regulator [Saprospiraceae bacterium]|nr:helix-turn-helix transcriptional regulator [Saprospiraceae bacterium]